ncbi:hypothetical protein ACOSQ3_010628 [Xanthoceras sorbifolium]
MVGGLGGFWKWLQLLEAFNGENFISHKAGFLNSKLCVSKTSNGLKFIKIKDGAMPLLKFVPISAYPLLNDISSEIRNLRERGKEKLFFLVFFCSLTFFFLVLFCF